jgi:4-hydroxy-3-polyprenylbenzoate decarboxylase
MKLIIAISGASGAKLGMQFVKYIPKDIQIHIVATKKANLVLQKENQSNITIHNNKDVSASIASGSFRADAMIVIPCSTNTLAKIACGISDNLLTRSASVMLKEKKNLILAVREMPLSTIALENMHKLSSYGVSIAPPIMGYYSNQTSLEDMEKFLFGKWLDLLGIDNNLYDRWEG